MRCPVCKAEIEDGSQYCDLCGSRTGGGRSSITVRDESGQIHHSNSTVALVSLLLVAAALLILGGFWLLTWQAQQEQMAAMAARLDALAAENAALKEQVAGLTRARDDILWL